MVRIQDQRALAAHIHAAHITHTVHLHHFLHTAALLRQRNHGCYLFVLQLLDLHIQLVIAKLLTEDLDQAVRSCLKCFLIFFRNLLLDILRHIRVDSLETDRRILLL